MSAIGIDAVASPATNEPVRGRWSSRLSFVLAAAGSAVGLGSIWKFPYITGMNGGGWFVVVYLACIVAVALPIMIAEILIGRCSQRSPVAAFHVLSGERSGWAGVAWLGITAAFLILSYYFVVSGWTLHYAWLAVSGRLLEGSAVQYAELFSSVHASAGVNLFWQLTFIVLTMGVVLGGVQKGIERCCRVLVPLLLIMMIMLAVQAAKSPGFERGLDFVFGLRCELTAHGVHEALGHSFFTLSLGMGAMITYGSYVSRHEDAVAASAAVAGFDTLVSLLACVMLFPIVFAFGLQPDAGPGLVFVSLPAALMQMPAGGFWATLFFVLLAVAALASTVSLLEVLVSHLVDRHRMSRHRACLLSGAAVALAGIPAALSGATHWFGRDFRFATAALFGGEGKNWFDFVDYVSSNWLLPASGLGVALFFAWRVGAQAREQAFKAGTRFGRLYWTWVRLLRFLVPPAIVAVFLHAIGAL
jgi:NSS family neurotransmitter:Na+ symporter